MILSIGMGAKAQLSCESIFASSPKISAWQKLSKKMQQATRYASFFRKNTSDKIERRIFVLNTGLRRHADPSMDSSDIRIDAADPSLILPIHYPNGITKYRMNFSGMRFIESGKPEDFFKGGVFTIKRSRGFYTDGTEMTGSYHGGSWPWDVVIYRNDNGENIAFGGVMQQTEPGKLPDIMRDNYRRSRWWGKVVHLETAPGEFEERVIWQAPLHDFNKIEPTGWVNHGYGGTLLTRFNPATGVHEPVKNKNGNYYLYYEKVTEEKSLASGRTLPWVTTEFVREMDPTLKFTVGDEVLASNIISPKTGNYFKATRRGDENGIDGYLREGGNVLSEMIHGLLIKASSMNDFVGKYGICLDYLLPGEDPKSTFKPVIDDNGELIDFAETMRLREFLNATWIGRPQLNYAPDGSLWMALHFVPIGRVPKGGPVEGWPSAEDFPKYARIPALIPVKIVYDHKGQPNLVLDIDQQWSYMFQ